VLHRPVESTRGKKEKSHLRKPVESEGAMLEEASVRPPNVLL
jgi:hypothetical protein